jgi:FixJ family two-component response regulator
MRQSAVVLCNDKPSLDILEANLRKLEIEYTKCHSKQQALEQVMTGHSSILVVDFDLPGADEAMRMANLLPVSQKPALLGVATRVWPGTGQAFLSGAHRILYRPLDSEPLKEALKAALKSHKPNRRKSERYEAKTLVYLDYSTGTLSGISIDIGEHGLAVQATEAVPIATNLSFRCILPGTKVTIHGHADVIWASDQGRAGLFFSQLAPAARKHLKEWIHRRHHKKNEVRDLLPPADAHVEFAASE